MTGIGLRGAIIVGLVGCAAGAVAADLRVLSAAAAKGPLSETAAAFERETGHHVILEFTTAGRVDSRIAGGERADLVVSSRARLDAMAAKGVRTGAVRDLGTVHVGVAVRAGSPKPDVSTVEGFRAALLAAQSVAYTDPAAGGTAGSHFATVVERLGVADALASKRYLAADGLDVMRKIKRGEAELGITQVSEILLVDRATYVGPLPSALQQPTIYAVFIPANAESIARAFADALTSATGRARFDAAGFE
jgi:molybdate transport system substrate-binding protein